MPYTEVDISYTATLRSAMHIGAGFGMAKLLDDQMVQGRHPDEPGIFPYIPGSTLKGRLLHHARELSSTLDWKHSAETETRLFGRADDPGPLTFTNAYLTRDLVLDNPGITSQWSGSPGHHERSFVSLSRERRVALEQRLFSIQVADAKLTFEGHIFGYLPSENDRCDLALLVAAGHMLTHLGGHKGRGLGNCQIDFTTITTITNALDGWQTCLEPEP